MLSGRDWFWHMRDTRRPIGNRLSGRCGNQATFGDPPAMWGRTTRSRSVTLPERSSRRTPTPSTAQRRLPRPSAPRGVLAAPSSETVSVCKERPVRVVEDLGSSTGVHRRPRPRPVGDPFREDVGSLSGHGCDQPDPCPALGAYAEIINDIQPEKRHRPRCSPASGETWHGALIRPRQVPRSHVPGAVSPINSTTQRLASQSFGWTCLR